MPAYCSSCGAATFSGSATFCTKCGSGLGQVPASQQRTVPITRPRPSAPAPIQPIQVTVRLPKSVGVALLLALLFGPFGLLYATVKGGLIMLAVEFFGGILLFLSVVAAGSTGSLNAPGAAIVGGLALLWLFAFGIQIVCAVWAVMAAQSYNREILFSMMRA
jgi:hypothetical protein